MTVLTRWDPFRELASLQNRMNRLFEEQYGGGREESLTTGAFVPPVDIYEDEHSIQLKLEVPGIEQKDLEIKVENNVLTVSGERKFEKEQKEENFHRVERRYGSFSRSFTLPNTVSTEETTADYNNGVLTVRLAKRAEAKPKQIKVSIGNQQPTLEGKQVAAEGKKGQGQAA
jgi:HSP20 family protein